MRELTDILNVWQAVRAEGRGAALATVVRVEGSAYRRPGARMLIHSGNSTVGGVSGGCLERDVIYRSAAVIESDVPIVVRYDTSPDIDGRPGMGLGCGGIIDVLIEPLKPGPDEGFLEAVRVARKARKPVVVATVIASKSESAKIGQRVVFDQAGKVLSTFDESLAAELAPLAEAALRETKTSNHRIDSEGAIELLVEFIPPVQELVIFGAGPDAGPLVNVAKGLGWHTTIVDLRSAATLHAIPGADVFVRATHETVGGQVRIPAHAAVVVMTHNYVHDRAILKALLADMPAYVGVLGPKHRTEQLLRELEEEGVGVAEGVKDQLRYPVGLNIGAESAEEIALAVVAEIVALKTGRPGSPLCKWDGPIHDAARDGDAGRVATAAGACPIGI